MSLFEELKRRRVFRLIIAYVIVAWAIIEVVTAIEAPLNLPDWFDTAVIVLLGLGFPIAVIMSWVYDVTPEGVVRDDGDARPVQIDYGKIALGAVIVLGTFLAGTMISDRESIAPSTPSGLRQFEINEHPDNQPTSVNETRGVRLTPDGRTIVVQATVGGERQLYRRELSSLEFVPIDGTKGVGYFFTFSPDGRSIAFESFATESIQIVPVGGGLASPLVALDGRLRSLSWGASGSVVYTETPFSGLKKVPATGGPVTTEDVSDPDVQYRHASFVPGSEWIVLAVGERGSGLMPSPNDEIAIMSPDGELHMTGIAGSTPRFSSSGHLVYFASNALMVAPFDFGDLQRTGATFTLVDDVYYSRTAHYDISTAGILVYRRDSARGSQRLVWVDRSGAEEDLPLTRGRFSHAEISPDGNILAVTMAGPEGPDLWTFSLNTGEATQWTFDSSRETTKVWTPDGQNLYFESGIDPDTFWISLDAPGKVHQLTDSESSMYPFSITSDGRYLLIDEWYGSFADGNNFGLIDLDGDREFQYLVATDSRDSHPSLSPDDRYLSYMSDVSGSLEVYVRRFPLDETGPRRATVTNDSWQPTWGKDSGELFYWDLDDEIFYVVETDFSNGLQFSQPQVLFSTSNYEFEGAGAYDYDVTRDKFIMVTKPTPESTSVEIVLIENWTDLLNDASATQ